MNEIKKLIIKYSAIELIMILIASAISWHVDNGRFGFGFFIIHTPIILQYLLMRISLIIPNSVNTHITIIKVILFLNIDVPLQFLFFVCCIIFGFTLDADAIYEYCCLAVSIILKIILFKKLNKLKTCDNTAVKA